MKRIYTLASLFFALSTSGFAQGAMDAFNLSYNDLTGTARSVSMGGAFGALGGDISGIAINPAGIGVYKSSEIVTTLNFTNNKTKSTMFNNEVDGSKFKFYFDNLAFVGAVPLNSDDVPFINFGFSYNKLKSFDRHTSMRGNNLHNSLTDYMADRATASGVDAITDKDPYEAGADWLGALGYDSGLIGLNDEGNGFGSILGKGETVSNDLRIREKGSISSYDFNVGTTISDILSIGATVSVTDLYYRQESVYEEIFDKDGASFLLNNGYKSEGTGWQVKAGFILKPINELRIGVAYHSPTWYHMTDRYYATVDALGQSTLFDTPDDFTDYKLRTPDKWVFSLAGVLGQKFILSGDYEITNYHNNMKLDGRGDFWYDFADENADIKNYFKSSSTVRLGAEYRITPQFSARVGYMWQESPVKDMVKEGNEEVYTVGTIPHFSLVGDANYFTWGLGYRFTPNFYTDVAFVIKNRTDDLYTFSKRYYDGDLLVNNDPTTVKTNLFSGLLTFGYKF